jgi:hypothetical protein
MDWTPTSPITQDKDTFPAPPRLHWASLFIAIAGSEGLVLWLVPQPYREFFVNVVIAAWPIYLCLWIRRIDYRSLSLYWALASFATGFLFSWLLWIVVIFEIREELLEHYNRRESTGLRLNLFMTLFFSFIYFQYHLNRITREKATLTEEGIDESQSTTQRLHAAFPVLHLATLPLIAGDNREPSDTETTGRGRSLWRHDGRTAGTREFLDDPSASRGQ